MNAIPLLSGAWLERPLVWLHHRSPGRLRVSAPGVDLEPVRQALAELPGVRASLSPVSATLLLEHNGDEDSLLVALYANLPRRPAEVARLRTWVQERLSAADRRCLSLTSGWLDLKTAVPLALGLYGAGLVLRRGLRMPHNVTLLYWALSGLAGE